MPSKRQRNSTVLQRVPMVCWQNRYNLELYNSMSGARLNSGSREHFHRVLSTVRVFGAIDKSSLVPILQSGREADRGEGREKFSIGGGKVVRVKSGFKIKTPASLSCADASAEEGKSCCRDELWEVVPGWKITPNGSVGIYQEKDESVEKLTFQHQTPWSR